MWNYQKYKKNFLKRSEKFSPPTVHFINILTLRYNDKVNMLTIHHQLQMKSLGKDRQTRRQKFKATCVISYNEFM